MRFKTTGVAREKILTAAEWLAKPNADGTRVKASFAIEKAFIGQITRVIPMLSLP